MVNSGSWLFNRRESSLSDLKPPNANGEIPAEADQKLVLLDFSQLTFSALSDLCSVPVHNPLPSPGLRPAKLSASVLQRIADASSWCFDIDYTLNRKRSAPIDPEVADLIFHLALDLGKPPKKLCFISGRTFRSSISVSPKC